VHLDSYRHASGSDRYASVTTDTRLLVASSHYKLF
jgi:hypothetical protein